jgi:hypothetical protein
LVNARLVKPKNVWSRVSGNRASSPSKFRRNGSLSLPRFQVKYSVEFPFRRKPTRRNVSPSKVTSTGT